MKQGLQQNLNQRATAHPARLRSARNIVGKSIGPTWSKLVKGAFPKKRHKLQQNITTNLAKISYEECSEHFPLLMPLFGESEAGRIPEFLARFPCKKSRKVLGLIFSRADVSRIFIFGPPDFFADFLAGFFLLIFVGKSAQKNPPGKSPAKSSKNYTTKIPDTFLQRGRAKKFTDELSICRRAGRTFPQPCLSVLSSAPLSGTFHMPGLGRPLEDQFWEGESCWLTVEFIRGSDTYSHCRQRTKCKQKTPIVSLKVPSVSKMAAKHNCKQRSSAVRS